MLDMRWFADVAWSMLGPERTLIGLQCNGQDQQVDLPASGVFATYDSLKAIMKRSASAAWVRFVPFGMVVKLLFYLALLLHL